MSMLVTEFLMVDFPSTFNWVIGRPLLKALKVVVLIYCLIVKFPTATRTRQVWGRQYVSRECYNRSLELVRNEREPPQMMEVEKVTNGPMETNIDPYLLEEESTIGPIEELVEIPMDPSWVVKVGKGLNDELAQKLVVSYMRTKMCLRGHMQIWRGSILKSCAIGWISTHRLNQCTKSEKH